MNYLDCLENYLLSTLLPISLRLISLALWCQKKLLIEELLLVFDARQAGNRLLSFGRLPAFTKCNLILSNKKTIFEGDFLVLLWRVRDGINFSSLSVAKV